MNDDRPNRNPFVTPPSADELAVLEDPRVRAMRQPPRHFPPATIDLDPKLPIEAPSRFVYPDTHRDTRLWHRVEWLIHPPRGWVGDGCGFPRHFERPKVLQDIVRPAKPAQFGAQSGYFVVSPAVRELFCHYDASAVEFCEIDWEFRDGTRLEGYGLLDIIKLLPAYDYARSRIKIELRPDDSKWVSIRHFPVVLRTDLPPDIHFFREERWRRAFFSRELGSELAALAGKDLYLLDPHLPYTLVELPKAKRKTRPPAPSPAIVHALPSAAARPEQAWRALRREVARLADDGELAAAERLLCDRLRELPESPLHVALATAIVTPAADVARYLDDFVINASKECTPKVLYAELNGFTINPDSWFFDVCAFAKDPGRETQDWLGDFYASTDRSCLIEGLEPLQAVYAQRDTQGPALLKGHDDAKRIVETLVVIRFQRLLQQALALTPLAFPLLAAAHDDPGGLVEIKRA